MAIFNEILSGRYNRALQKIFAIKGSAPVRQLGGEILPIHALWSGVENRFLEQWNRFASAGTAAGGVGNFSQVMLRNPVTSGVIAVIERISFCEVGAADLIFISQDTGTAQLGVAQGQRCLDNRAVRGATQTLGPACQVFTNNAGVSVTGGVIAKIPTQANVDYPYLIMDENQEITLAPGDVLEITTSSLNVSLNYSILWRERALEESEKT